MKIIACIKMNKSFNRILIVSLYFKLYLMLFIRFNVVFNNVGLAIIL